MSQSWVTLLASHTLADSRAYIQGQFDSLRTSFAEATQPSSPVTGQRFYNSTEKKWYFYNGSDWFLVGDVGLGHWLGCVPRGESKAYPMTADLHVGGYKIKNMADPVADTDATTKQWVRDKMIDEHDHTATGEGTGLKIDWDDLSGNNATANTLLAIASGGSTLINRHWDVGLNTTPGTPLTSWGDAIDLSVNTYANEKKLVVAGAHWSLPTSDNTTFYLRLLYDQGAGDVEFAQVSQATSNAQVANTIVIGSITPTVQTTVTYTLQSKKSSGGGTITETSRWILVL